MRKYILFLTMILQGVIFAQTATEIPNFQPKSPEAAAFLKYGDYPVDLSTGVPNISIPIYTIKSGAYELPLSLSYHASGIKVDEESSWVGLGWNLNFGAQIILDVRDAPDEYNVNTYDSIPNANDVSTYISDYPINGYYQNYMINLRHESWVRDVYNFSSPTASGKFIIDKLSPFEVTVYPPDSFKVEYIGGSSSAKRFKITDTGGNQYIFNNTRERSQTPQQYQEMDYTSAWFVDKIVTANNDIINFEYDDGGEINQVSYGEVVTHSKITDLNYICTGGKLYEETISPIQNSQTTLHTYTKKIKKINFRGGRIVFNSINDRLDCSSVRLDNLEIQKNINDSTFQTINKYQFFHSYFVAGAPTSVPINKTHRLRLDKISNLLGIDAPEETEFIYSPVELPAKDSKATDYWGYYNGKQNLSRIPHQLIPFSPIGIVTRYESIGEADRRVDPDKLRAGTLIQIRYPTKGTTKFEYEPNIYYGINKLSKYTPEEITDTLNGTGIGVGNPEDVMIPGIDDNLVCTSSNPDDCLQTKIIPFQTINASGELSVHILNDDTVPDSEMHYRYARVRLFNSSGDIVNDVQGNPCDANGHSSQLFTFQLSNLNSGVIKMEVWGRQLKIDAMKLKYYNNDTIPQNNYGMGLRIKRITNMDSDDITKIGETMYEYNQSNDVAKSSGKLIKDIAASFRTNLVVYASSSCCPFSTSGGPYGCAWKTFENVSFVSNSISGVEGNSIVYSDVVEKKIDRQNNANGFVKYKFITDEDFLYDTNGAIKVEMSHMRGRQLLKEVFKTSTNGNPYIVNKQKNDYFEDNRKVSLITGFKLFQNYYVQTNPINNTLPAPLDAIIEPVSYSIPVKWFYLKSSENTDFFYDANNNSTGSIITTKTYNYDNPLHLQLSTQITESSLGETLETKYFYPQDSEMNAEPYMSSLISKNQIATPVVTQTFRSGNKVSEQKTIYSDWGNNLFAPEIIQTAKGTLPLENRLHYNKMDNTNGNVLQLQRENGTLISYIWGYNKTQPIAKIENATNAQVAAAIGMDLKLVNEINLPANLRTLLPDAMITTFTYIPLVGVSTITDPKGQTTHYNYDNLGRLVNVKDDDNNTLSENEYHYKD